MGSGGFEIEPEGANESVEVIDDALVEAVELAAAVVVETGIGGDWAEESGRPRGVDALEELEEDQGDRVALRQELITARVGQLGDETFSAKF